MGRWIFPGSKGVICPRAPAWARRTKDDPSAESASGPGPQGLMQSTLDLIRFKNTDICFSFGFLDRKYLANTRVTRRPPLLPALEQPATVQPVSGTLVANRDSEELLLHSGQL